MTSTIVPVEAIGFDAWQSLWLEYIGSEHDAFGRDRGNLIYQRLVGREYALWGLAVVVGQPLGLAHFCTRLSTWSPGPIGQLQDLYVRPEARRRGLGKALFGAVAQATAALGCQSIEWQTHLSNTAAQNFYRSTAMPTEFLSYSLPLA